MMAKKERKKRKKEERKRRERGRWRQENTGKEGKIGGVLIANTEYGRPFCVPRAGGRAEKEERKK